MHVGRHFVEFYIVRMRKLHVFEREIVAPLPLTLFGVNVSTQHDGTRAPTASESLASNPAVMLQSLLASPIAQLPSLSTSLSMKFGLFHPYTQFRGLLRQALGAFHY